MFLKMIFVTACVPKTVDQEVGPRRRHQRQNRLNAMSINKKLNQENADKKSNQGAKIPNRKNAREAETK